MENLNKQKTVEREVKELIQKYNALYKNQLYEFFAKDGRERFVGKALKVLEKERDIFIHQEMKMVAVNEESFGPGNSVHYSACGFFLELWIRKKWKNTFLPQKRNIQFVLFLLEMVRSTTYYTFLSRISTW